MNTILEVLTKFFGIYQEQKLNFFSFRDSISKNIDLISKYESHFKLDSEGKERLLKIYRENFWNQKVIEIASMLRQLNSQHIQFHEEEYLKIVIDLCKKTHQEVSIYFIDILINFIGDKKYTETVKKALSIIINN